MNMVNTAVESKGVALKSELNQKFPATLQFFVVLEKGKPFRVLPAVLNLRRMSDAEMAELPIKIGLKSRIIIPLIMKPWSEISREADHFFLMLQSRNDWGKEIIPGSNLLEIKKVRQLVELLEESLNNFSWRADYLAGKFNSGEIYEPAIEEKPAIEIQPKPEGVEPGQNWKL